jgi:peptidoglycan/LPS O-acetylase OafA/YrhL
VRKFTKPVLAVFVAIFAGLLVYYLVLGPQGDVIGGWSINKQQLSIGFTRLLYPFFAGVLLSRLGKLIHIKGAFAVCSLLVFVVLAVPRIGGPEHLWMNGLYEAFVIIIMFPLIVAIGAGGELTGKTASKVCKFFGDISYPIYITHYPLIYWYTAWVIDNKVPMGYSLCIGSLVLVSSIAIAYACLKLYDEPVREWLRKRFLVKKTA